MYKVGNWLKLLAEGARQVAGFVRRIGATGLCLFLGAHCSALAQTAPTDSADRAIPPVERATFHQLVFANEDLAVLNNLYPPGGDSGFHAHYRDVFYVVIQPAPTSGQRLGGALTPVPMAPAGTTGYSPVDGEPRVHKVINGGGAIYQLIVVEICRARPSGNVISSRETAPQYVQIFDNPRMRAWRLILAPGQAVPAISQGDNGVRIVVRGGLLTTTRPGLPDQTLALQAGNFAVQERGDTRALRNSGTEAIELVEMELK